MHAIMVTFTSDVLLCDLHGPFETYAHALDDVPGLVMKTWINRDDTVGGFHVFADEAAGLAYLSGSLCATLLNNPSFSNFTVQHFDVVDDLSAITHSPAEVVRA